MAGIRVTGKTKAPEAMKLISKIASYRFENQYEELKGHKDVDEALENAIAKLKTLL